jgi:hypothetical protein
MPSRFDQWWATYDFSGKDPMQVASDAWRSRIFALIEKLRGEGVLESPEVSAERLQAEGKVPPIESLSPA